MPLSYFVGMQNLYGKGFLEGFLEVRISGQERWHGSVTSSRQKDF